MRAMVINRVGGPEVLELAEFPTPRPEAGEVLVKTAFVSINPADWKDREGHLARYAPYVFPYIIGMDAAGVVAEVGAGVAQFKPGDRVVTSSNHGHGKPGTYAEYVAAPAIKVAHLPAAIDFAAASTIPVAGITAWQAVRVRGEIKAGQRVLIHGGAGGVGGYAIQFAKALGAQVAATCSGSKSDYVRGLGADLVIDYKTQDIAKTLLGWAPQGVDAIIDAVSCGTLPMAFDLLAKGGVLVSVATLVGDGDIEGDIALAAKRGLRKVFAVMSDDNSQQDMDDIIALIVSGKVKTPPLTILPLEKAGEAHQLLQDGKVHGKLVLKVADV